MSVIIRLQNLPWAANATDIRSYFRGLSIPDGGVHIVGGEQGDAFIAFSTDEDARQAMQRDGGKLKEVMIKLLLSSRTEMMKVIEQARQEALNLQQIINSSVQPVTPSAPQLSASQQGDGNNLDKEKDEEDDKSSSGEYKRDRRRSRSRSRSRGRDRDRSRDRSRDRDRSRERRRERRRRDRSRSRDRYRSRRDRSRDRRGSRSRDREYFRSNRYRDNRGSFDKKEQNETDSQKMQKTYLPEPAPASTNKVLLPTPPGPPEGLIPYNQAGKSESHVENFPVKKTDSSSSSTDIKSPDSSSMQPLTNINNSISQMDGPSTQEVQVAPAAYIPSQKIQMIPGFAGMMFPNMPLRGAVPARDAWFGPGPQGPLPFAVPQLPMMASSEVMGMPNFPQHFNPMQDNPWNSSNINPIGLDSNCCIEIHGLPLNVSYFDILQFFQGFPIEQGNIKMINDTQGKRTGIAYVKFTQPQWKQSALNLNGKMVNGNIVDIMHLKESIFQNAIDNFKPAQEESSKDNKVELNTNREKSSRTNVPDLNSITGVNDSKENEIKGMNSDAVIIQGVPVKCSDRDIFDFFSELGIAPIHIHILQDSTGNPVGEAFCQFESPDQAVRASLKNNSNMGRSTVTVRVVNKDDVNVGNSPHKFSQGQENNLDSKQDLIGKNPYPDRERSEIPRKRERVSRFDKPIDRPEPSLEMFEARGKKPDNETEISRFSRSNKNSNENSEDQLEQSLETGSNRNDVEPRPLMEIEIPDMVQDTDREMDQRSGVGDPNAMAMRNNMGGMSRLNDMGKERGPLLDARSYRISDPRAEKNMDPRGIDPRSDRPLDRGLGNKPDNSLNSRATDPRSERLLDPRGPPGSRGNGSHDPRSRNDRAMDQRQGPMEPRPGLLDCRPGLLDPRPALLDQRPALLESRPGLLDPRPGLLDPRTGGFLDPRAGGPMGPRGERPMDPRTKRSMDRGNMEFRGDRNNDPRDRRMEIQDGPHMDPRQRNMNSRMEMNSEHRRQDRFSDGPFDNNMDPRDNRNMPPRMENRDFPMDRMDSWMDRDSGFPRGPGGFRDRPHPGDMRGDRKKRDDWNDQFSKPYGGDSGRGGGMMRGRGRGRGDFSSRGRGGRSNRPPLISSPGQGDEGMSFIEDNVVKNFGGPGRVVAVENLHFKASVEEVIDFFRDFGIEYEDVIRRFDDLGRPTGDARIAFQSPEEARKAVETLSSKTMMGRTLRLYLLT